MRTLRTPVLVRCACGGTERACFVSCCGRSAATVVWCSVLWPLVSLCVSCYWLVRHELLAGTVTRAYRRLSAGNRPTLAAQQPPQASVKTHNVTVPGATQVRRSQSLGGVTVTTTLALVRVVRLYRPATAPAADAGTRTGAWDPPFARSPSASCGGMAGLRACPWACTTTTTTRRSPTPAAQELRVRAQERPRSTSCAQACLARPAAILRSQMTAMQPAGAPLLFVPEGNAAAPALGTDRAASDHSG